MLYCLKKHMSFILEFDSYLKIICFVGQAMRHQCQKKNKKQKKERIKIKFMQEQRGHYKGGHGHIKDLTCTIRAAIKTKEYWLNVLYRVN